MVPNWILILSGLIILTRVVGLLTTLSGVAIYVVFQNHGLVPLVAIVVLVIVTLFIALYLIRKSLIRPIIDIGVFLLVGVGWLLSKFASITRAIGRVFPFTSAYHSIFDRYPGEEFANDLRKKFLREGVKYIEKGEISVDESSPELAEETRKVYYTSGDKISNGEAVFGFSLAGIGILQIGTPIQTAALSVALAITVAFRVTAMESVMYRDPSPEKRPEQLKAMLGWNRAVSNGAEVLKFFTIARFMYSIDERLFDIYLQLIFMKSLEGGGAGLRDVIDLWPPLWAILQSKMYDIPPLEASYERYEKNVFEPFSIDIDQDEEN